MKNIAHFLIPVTAIAFLTACSDESSLPSEEPLTEHEAMILEGKRKARVCTSCHGPTGISRIPAYPSLAGLSKEYLSKQLHAFRSGERDNPTMSSIALNLSDEDIEALSHYFASLPGPRAR